MSLVVNKLNQLAIIKRLRQRWDADKTFREAVIQEPQLTLKRYGFDLDAEEVRPCWDIERRGQLTPTLAELQRVLQKKQQEQEQKNKTLPVENINFADWRERQSNRLRSQIHPIHNGEIGHLPVAFELTKGCSVGCWFCGVSAPKLGDIFLYTPENASLWNDVLVVVKKFIGEAAGMGFCYWATDPLDNPDYELFCNDFHATLGTFPQTTTAQPLKNVERTKRLLKLSQEKGCPLNRFSILSLKTFNQVMEAFSPNDLLDVELALQNPESTAIKAISGRGRAKLQVQNYEGVEQPTIACVSGLLFNMIDKSVKLISPIPACDRYPNGYITYAEATFTDAEDLEGILQGFMEQHMSLEVKPDTTIKFRSDLQYQPLDNGFQLSARFTKRKFTSFPFLKEVGNMIYQQQPKAQEIVEALQKLGQDQEDTYYTLHHLYQKGVLEEI